MLTEIQVWPMGVPDEVHRKHNYGNSQIKVLLTESGEKRLQPDN